MIRRQGILQGENSNNGPGVPPAVAAVAVEAAVAAIALFIGIQRGRRYGWILAPAFGIFVLFDFVRLAGAPVSPIFHAFLLFIAAVSSLGAVLDLIRSTDPTG